MGSRLHGNDGGRRRTPHGRRRHAHIVIPATAGIHGGGRQRWVPVSTGTTVGGGAPHTVGDGAPTSSFPRRRESTAGEPAMGSRLHGNDGGRRRTPHGRRRRAHIVIPATAGIHGVGETGMGSRLHGNDGGTHIVIPATAGIHGGESLRWVPVSTGRRRAHIVIPAKAGIHGGESLRWVPVSTRAGGGAPTSSFPRRRESTAWGACDGFPSTRERRKHPHRHCRDGGNPRRGEPAMGSRLHGNDGGRRRTSTR